MAGQKFSITELMHRNGNARRNEILMSDVGIRHRDITGGGARAAVFGVSDGLVSNVALILGVAGAHPAAPFVRVAGIAGLIGGALSMALGEYVSMKAQRELFEKEIALEAHEIKTRPDFEKRELIQLYRRKGIPKEIAEEFVEHIMADPEVALHTHAREELGVDPGSIGSPIEASLASFGSFAVGAILPLLPWFFSTGTTGVLLTIILALIGTASVGVLLALFTGRSLFRTAVRQMFLSGVAAGITYLLGHLIGFSGA